MFQHEFDALKMRVQQGLMSFEAALDHLFEHVKASHEKVAVPVPENIAHVVETQKTELVVQPIVPALPAVGETQPGSPASVPPSAADIAAQAEAVRVQGAASLAGITESSSLGTAPASTLEGNLPPVSAAVPPIPTVPPIPADPRAA